MPHYERRQDSASTYGGSSTRPVHGIQRRHTARTRYMQMLLDLDAVPKWHNLAVAISAWIILAGFVIFPGTFTSIQSIDEEDQSFNGVEKWVLSRVKNLPLLVVAGVCCGIGAIGMIGFWIRWRRNYVWVCNRVFLPGTLNSLAGLLSTIVNVYTAQNHQWSITAKVSAIVEAICLAICGVLFLFYSNWMLARIRREHNREFDTTGDYDEAGIIEKMKRKAQEPSPEAGRIV
jgi:hypothetical protein